MIKTEASRVSLVSKCLFKEVKMPSPKVKRCYEQLMDWLVVDYLVKRRANPNWLTTLGFLVSIPAGILLWLNHHFIAMLVIIFSGWCDSVDGSVARKQNRVTKIGAFYDSILDRFTEAAILIGIAAYFFSEDMFRSSVFSVLTIVFSWAVSYSRARAEGLGFECTVGLMQRAGRMITLIIGLLLNFFFRDILMEQFGPKGQDLILIFTLVTISVLSSITVLQRLIFVSKAPKARS